MKRILFSQSWPGGKIPIPAAAVFIALVLSACGGSKPTTSAGWYQAGHSWGARERATGDEAAPVGFTEADYCAAVLDQASLIPGNPLSNIDWTAPGNMPAPSPSPQTNSDAMSWINGCAAGNTLPGPATSAPAAAPDSAPAAAGAPTTPSSGNTGQPGTGEQVLARELYPRLEADWLLIADRAFYNWPGWGAAADSGAALLWRVSSIVRLPVPELLPDGSYRSVLIPAKITGRARQQLIDAARAGQDLDPGRARAIRVIEYEVTDRDGQDELIALITTITDPRQASAAVLATAYQQRWEHEAGNAQLKTYLRGPGKILRSKSPDMVRQEIYGYLLTHHAVSALICKAATAAGIDPDRVKFKRTVRIIRRRAADPAFSP